MKNIIYIGFLAIVLLFSCSKEQPLRSTNSFATVESSEITIPIEPIIVSDDNLDDGDDDSGDIGITDPEKEDKEKTNKKAKN